MISGVRIHGRGFVDATNLTFFPKRDQRIAVVFGRNGSGKTTVGDSFSRFSIQQELTNQSLGADDLVAFLLANGTKEDLMPSQIGATTLVFNEHFIEQNVRITDDGIRALVLFGGAGNTQDDLDAATTVRETAQKELNLAEGALERALAARDEQRDFALADLRGGWADRERLLKGNKQNSPVNGTLLDGFLTMTRPEEELSSAKAELVSLGEQISRSRGEEEKPDPVPGIDTTGLELGFSLAVLGRTITPPSGAGLAGLVARTMEEHGIFVQQAQNFFADEHVSICPLCQQEVSPKYRVDLLEAIEAAVDQPAKDFVDDLEAHKLPELKIAINKEVAELNQSRADVIKLLVGRYNSAVERWNRAVEEKKTSLYSPMEVDFSQIGTLVQDLDQELQALERERIEWNAGVTNFKEITQRALALNRVVSRLELQARIDACFKAQEEFESAQDRFEAASIALEAGKRAVLELQVAMKREDVAADEINRSLSVVFADPNRLKLIAGSPDEGGGKFLLQSRGRSIRPHRLSVGERNVLALCYFFTLLRQSIDDGLDPNTTLVVLDDPISSVDTDCRIGILSFVEAQVEAWLKQAQGARTLFLTHDVGVFQDLGKTSRAILESLPPRSQGTWSLASWVLRNSGEGDSNQIQLVRQKGSFDEPLHEYKTLLSFVFEYAQTGASQPDSDVTAIGLGNALRRVFEAFCVFIYNQKSITSSPVEEAYRALGRGPLAQPLRQSLVTVLHGGSHNKDRMMMLSDFSAGSVVDHDEKALVARRILALMYALQPEHMKRYLAGDAVVVLEEWEKDLL